MSKGRALVSLFLLMGLTLGTLYFAPLAMNVYSPLPAMMAPWSDRVFVEGRILHANETSAVGVEVTLFGTDELISDVVVTDQQGRFLSSIQFDTGQVITVSVDGQRLWELGAPPPFVEYDYQEDWGPFDLGTFYLPEVKG